MKYCALVVGLGLLIGCQDEQHVDSSESGSAQGGTGEQTATGPEREGPGDSSSQSLFERRILPIMRSPKPSSCTECHLTGVELADYIRPTQAETFAALSAAGMIDRDQPDLILAAVRKEELSAFRVWIVEAVQNPGLLSARSTTEIGPGVPVEVIRHGRSDRVLESFIENVWVEAERCAACHSPRRNQKQVERFGEEISWVVPDDPQRTLERLLDSGLVDLDRPEESLLLTKPTLQVEHWGGQKMLVGDRSYKQFRRFIDDYAATASGAYQNASDLPERTDEVAEVTDIWLKLTGVPAEYDGRLLRVDVYALTAEGAVKERVATSDRAVFGEKNLWQHSLTLIAPRGSDRAGQLSRERLPEARYLLRILVDQDGRLQEDFRNELRQEDVVGEVRIESRWPAGYGRMTEVAFPPD